MSLHHMLRAAAGSAGPSDPYFEYNTLLLTGNGTNGAQNNTFLDSSTNNFTITRNGNTTQGTFSPYGNLWSNYFDGSGDYLASPSNTAFAFGTGDYTMECYVFLPSITITNRLIEFSAGGDNVEVNGDGSLSYYNGSTSTNSAASVITSSTWNHIAIVRSSGTVKGYVNGISVLTQATTPNTTTARVLNIAGASNYLFSGYISNFRVVKGTAVYTSNFTPSTTPLTAVSGTSLLTCQSNRFIDNSSNNFTLTVNGNTSVQRFSPFNPTAPYSANTIGGSGYFDGSGDYLTSPSSANVTMGSGDFTIELWAYPLAAPAPYWTCIISIGSTTTAGREIRISQGQSNYGTLGVLYPDNSNTGDNYPNSGYVLPLKTWTHIALCRSGTNLYLFANGNVIGSYSSVSFNQSATAYVNIANNPYNDPMFNGCISNVRVIKGTAVYTSTFTPPTAPLTAITNTSLLLNFTNAGIPDAAMMNDLETVGNAQVSTSVKKYGTGSLAFDGTGDGLSLPASINLALGAGDFTIEMWVNGSLANNSSSIGGSWPRLFTLGTAQGTGCIESFLYQGATVYVDISATDVITFSMSTLLSSAWNHFAVTRSGTSVKAFVNGTQVGSTATNSTNLSLAATTQSWIGSISASAGNFNGYIDDLRITKGYARYTANFTPPTAALPVY